MPPGRPVTPRESAMPDYLAKLPGMIEAIRSVQDVIITNIVLIGQTPAPTFREKKRATVFLERMAELGVDECTTDGYRNPIAIVRGRNPDRAPIFMEAHLDTFYNREIMYDYTIQKDAITGPGLLDNSLGVAVLLSMPYIFRHLGLTFESDVVLAGTIHSIGKGNLRGVRHLLKTWPTPIRGGICIEGVELGRLNYISDGMVRAEVACRLAETDRGADDRQTNAIVVLNEVINEILRLPLAQRPRTRVVIGKIAGGADHGKIAGKADLGFEIRSDSNLAVKKTYGDIIDLVAGVGHANNVQLKLKTISNLRAAGLRFNHPLVKSAGAVLHALQLQPVSKPTESALSIFLSHKIPAVTLGVSRGENRFTESATMKIEPMFTGIAQIIGVLQAIDSGVCDGNQMA